MSNEKQADLTKYDATFYHDGGSLAERAAQLILGHIASSYEFSSVVDFGCGAGGWLRAAARVIGERGSRAPRLVGIDGPYAERFAKCAGASFHFQNLEQRVVNVGRFDLAISMEVAEHLPPGRADTFVEDITNAADVVLFSAAIPGQGGDNHINEQWQSYWIRMFSRAGFRSFDVLRAKFWNDPLIASCPFYAANGFLHVRNGHPLVADLASKEVSPGSLHKEYPLDIVHPDIFRSAHFSQVGPRALLSQLPKAVVRAIARRRNVGR